MLSSHVKYFLMFSLYSVDPICWNLEQILITHTTSDIIIGYFQTRLSSSGGIAIALGSIHSIAAKLDVLVLYSSRE